MYKVLWLLKRIDGITHERFREHYERSHVVMTQKYIGHLLLSYVRNYRDETWGGGVPTDASRGEQATGGFGPVPWGYDCITEWTMPDEAAFDRINAIFADPVIGREFQDDEENFLDREAVLLVKCTTIDTGPGDGHGTTSLTRRIGEPA